METVLPFDSVKHEKEKAVARFNRLRRIVRLRQFFFQVLVVAAVVSWSSPPRLTAVLSGTGGFCVDLSVYFLNHHVVFLIGNAIIVLLLTLCRGGGCGDAIAAASAADFYDEYVKYSEAAAIEPTISPVTEEATDGGDERRIVVRAEEEAVSDCDDVAAAIEEATRLIERFRRTESEKLSRVISVRRSPELRRSATEDRRKTEDAAEIEALSGEEFRRRVEAFIDQHWSKKATLIKM